MDQAPQSKAKRLRSTPSGAQQPPRGPKKKQPPTTAKEATSGRLDGAEAEELAEQEPPRESDLANGSCAEALDDDSWGLVGTKESKCQTSWYADMEDSTRCLVSAFIDKRSRSRVCERSGEQELASGLRHHRRR